MTIKYFDGRRRRADGTWEQSIELELQGEKLGISSDFQLTGDLARFFQLNRSLLAGGMSEIERKLERHRSYFSDQISRKGSTLSYSFLTEVYGSDILDRVQLARKLSEEGCPETRNLLADCSGSILATQERMQAVSREYLTQWWYLFWDDVWRRNFDTIPELSKHTPDFSPHYRTSICYRPMTRIDLEVFLRHKGLWKQGGKKGFFTTGFLKWGFLACCTINLGGWVQKLTRPLLSVPSRIYFHLDEMVTRNKGSSLRIPIRLGPAHRPVQYSQLDRLSSLVDDAPPIASLPKTSLGRDVGYGTDHDDSEIRERPLFRFESVYRPEKQSLRQAGLGRYLVDRADRLGHHFKVWLGLSPFSGSGRDPPGVYLQLRETSTTLDAPRRA